MDLLNDSFEVIEVLKAPVEGSKSTKSPFSDAVKAELKVMGHDVWPLRRAYARLQLVWNRRTGEYGAKDFEKKGSEWVWEKGPKRPEDTGLYWAFVSDILSRAKTEDTKKEQEEEELWDLYLSAYPTCY